MKNIHILPTTQPTGIFETNSGLQFSIMNKVRYGEFKGFHIYITSDEELPYDDSIFATGAFYHRDAAKDIHIITKDTFHPNPNFCSRIILTTDDSLFKYGVQAIDDKFLEWFVKNSSCEFVEVNKKLVEFPLTFKMMYKIIIPQEEPKQETLEEQMYRASFANESPLWHDGFIAGGKYMTERMYIEEEVLSLILKFNDDKPGGFDASGWFEQFKKK